MRLLLIAVQSLDGFIAKHAISGTDFASPAEQEHFFAHLKSCDASIMGAETFRLHQEKIIRGSPSRLRLIRTREPERYRHLEKPGSLEFTSEGAKALVERLRGKGLQRVALLGGSSTYSEFLKEALVDELWISVEPVVFGTGLTLARDPVELRFHLQSIRRLKGDVLVLHFTREAPGPWWKRCSSWVFWLLCTLSAVVAGAVAGAVLFPLFAACFLESQPLWPLALLGARKLAFIAFIWAPGLGAVLTVMRNYRRKQGQ